MSAACRASRKTAVCGPKPGGEAAYYFKESCVLKDRSQTQRRCKGDDKIKQYVAFCKKEMAKLVVRNTTILNAKSLRYSPLPILGLDIALSTTYVKSAKQHADLTCHERIKLALEKYCKVFKKDIKLTATIERLTIMASLFHYGSVLNELDI